MVATQSTMLSLGSEASNFNLQDTKTGDFIDFQNYTGHKAYLISFICNHCPYVIHLFDHMVPYFNTLCEKGVAVFAICSNDQVHYPDDNPNKMAALAKKKNFLFPYLHDAKQKVAKAYQAACTPDFFLFDENKTLFYRGQYDGSRPGNDVQPSGDDLNKAVQAIFDNSPPPKIQTPSMGCNIKWISGNEPSYFPKQN